MYASKQQRTDAVRKTHARKQQYINSWKAARGCANCGESDPIVLDAHHRNRDEKLSSMKRTRTRGRAALWHLSWTDLPLELEKCDVLCANCHRREWAHTRTTVGSLG